MMRSHAAHTGSEVVLICRHVSQCMCLTPPVGPGVVNFVKTGGVGLFGGSSLLKALFKLFPAAESVWHAGRYPLNTYGRPFCLLLSVSGRICSDIRGLQLSQTGDEIEQLGLNRGAVITALMSTET